MGVWFVCRLEGGWWVGEQVIPEGSGRICFDSVEDGAFVTKWTAWVFACAGDACCLEEVWVCVDGVGCDDTNGVSYSYGGHFEHISC